MEKLEQEKTEKSKKRIMLKVERTKDAQHRKEWSRKHGHDTYGDEDSDTADQRKKDKKWLKGNVNVGL